MSYQGFEQLPVFKKAYQVSLDIHKNTKLFPKDEQYGLADQIRRSSKSVCANIAEGYAKQIVSKAEFRRFTGIALGSSDEMRVWLRYALDLGYIKQGEWQSWRDDYQEISKMLHGLYKSL